MGTLLLAFVFLIPVDEDKAQESFDIIVGESSYPAIPVVGDLTGMNLQSFYPGVLDNSSDEIMLFTALDTFQSDQNIFYRSMSMYNGYMGLEYSYYWHGYVSVLRPILSVISYHDLRFLNGLLQMVLIFVLVKKIWQKKGMIYGLVMFTSYILLMPMALMFSLQYTWVFYIAMLSALFLVSKGGWAAENGRYIVIFCGIGMLTSYFDLLTYPIFTWGIPVLWWLMMREPEGKGTGHIVEVVASGISWIFGYGIFWGMKWCLGSMILKRDVVQMAIDEIFLRSGLEEKLSLADRFSAAYINWKHYGYCIYALILLAWFIWGVVKGLRKGWTVHYNIFAYCLVGASSVVWYFTLANHTSVHHFFTYRIFGVSILAFLAVWAGAFSGVDSGGKQVQKGLPVKLLALALIGIGAVGCMLLAREDIWATNGYADHHKVRLSEQDVLTMEFRPTFPIIKDFGICVEPYKEVGTVEVTLLDGDDMIYQELYPLEGWGKEAYHSKPVEWKFKKGKEYRMQLRLLDSDQAVEILVTDDGVLPMVEYGTPRIQEVAVGGQLISGVTYWYRPTSRTYKIYLTLTWMGILTCLSLALYAAYDAVGEKCRNGTSNNK